MENKELNLVEILKDCPKGTKLYSPLFGEVSLYCINLRNEAYPIEIETDLGSIVTFTTKGIFNDIYSDAECLLFPSKENIDWSTFKIPKPKFRSFKTQRECWEEMHKHPDFGWVKGKITSELCQISCIFLSSTELNFSMTYKTTMVEYSSTLMLNGYTFTDGTPFGIIEE